MYSIISVYIKMKRLNGLCTNQKQFKCVIEMDNMYDEVTIETVSHWAFQKSVYNQHICNTYLTNNQNIFFPHETMWVPLKVIYLLGLNICGFKCIVMLQRNGSGIGSVFMQRYCSPSPQTLLLL